jgi:hypothetical protein
MDPSTMNEYAIGITLLLVVLLIIAWRQGILGESFKNMYLDGGGYAVAILLFLAGIGLWWFEVTNGIKSILFVAAGVALGIVTWRLDRKSRQTKEMPPEVHSWE